MTVPGSLAGTEAGVTPGAPAPNAGLQQHDVITQGQRHRRSSDYLVEIQRSPPGGTAGVTFVRGGRSGTR
jgi:S1-C subfamily serine protease